MIILFGFSINLYNNRKNRLKVCKIATKFADVKKIHLSKTFRILFIIKNYTYFFFFQQNPPWQIIKYSETGEVIEMKGIVMHILNELADKLNFT